MNSIHDGYPLADDIDGAILVLEDMLSGALEARGLDGRLSEIIRLLRHVKTKTDEDRNS